MSLYIYSCLVVGIDLRRMQSRAFHRQNSREKNVIDLSSIGHRVPPSPISKNFSLPNFHIISPFFSCNS